MVVEQWWYAVVVRQWWHAVIPTLQWWHAVVVPPTNTQQQVHWHAVGWWWPLIPTLQW